MARCVHCERYTAYPLQFQGGGPLCSNCHQAKVTHALAKGKANGVNPAPSKMKRGDIVEIQTSGSYARQWLVQGSAREPYKVSLTKSGVWQCGCPAGRTTPGGMAADPCKHVMQVQIKYGYVGQTLIGVVTGDKVTLASGLQVTTEPQAEPVFSGRRFRD